MSRDSRKALISVSDKTGVVEFARRLVELGFDILSTGGTATTLRGEGIAVTDVSDYTEFPEMMGGRIKTLHPRVHGGILHRRDEQADCDAAREHGIASIDIVAVNLYPFRETIRRPGVTQEEAIEQIDIGGPCMLRSAAKNFRWVNVVCRPDLYARVLDELEANDGQTTLDLRRQLSFEAYSHTAAYDTAIANYLTTQLPERNSDALPESLEIRAPRAQTLRYGENPHQKAAFYGDLDGYYRRLHGKELSYNNLLDLSAALELIEEFPTSEAAAVAIIKHTNPCGVALGDDLIDAWEKALATDIASANGGIVALNRTVDLTTAEAIHGFFSEIICAPAFEPNALAYLQKKKNRILIHALRSVRSDGALRLRGVPGGLLAQEPDFHETAAGDLKVVTKRAPTDEELAALLFAWKVVKHLKSNAIAFTSHDRSLGLGAGQMSRVDSARIAVMKSQNAGLDLHGSVVGSDAFFPFADGLIACSDAGATAAIQPGGSVRDDEVIDAANERDMAMVFTGNRHFRH